MCLVMIVNNFRISDEVSEPRIMALRAWLRHRFPARFMRHYVPTTDEVVGDEANDEEVPIQPPAYEGQFENEMRGQAPTQLVPAVAEEVALGGEGSSRSMAI